MRLGNYRDTITLQRPFTTNTKGKVSQTWDNIANVYASILPIRPVETILNGGAVTTSSYTIRIHWRADVDSTWRVQWGSRTLQISNGYDPDGRRRELELVGTCNG